ILTTFDDRELIQAGLQAGAQGYVLKDMTAEQLATTIRAVTQGQVLLHPDVAHKVLASLSPAQSEHTVPAPAPSTFVGGSGVEQLTEREREILQLIARGSTNHAIAKHLALSVKTVNNYVSNIFSKLQVADRAQAIIRARDAGLE
ncbi:MAG: DNA-binding response regulator, partial [Ktedonobacteraceae bacterium]